MIILFLLFLAVIIVLLIYINSLHNKLHNIELLILDLHNNRRYELNEEALDQLEKILDRFGNYDLEH